MMFKVIIFIFFFPTLSFSQDMPWQKQGIDGKYQYTHIAAHALISYYSSDYLSAGGVENPAEKGLLIAMSAGIAKEYFDKNVKACDPLIPKCIEATGKIDMYDIKADFIGALLGYGIYKAFDFNPFFARW